MDPSNPQFRVFENKADKIAYYREQAALKKAKGGAVLPAAAAVAEPVFAPAVPSAAEAKLSRKEQLLKELAAVEAEEAAEIAAAAAAVDVPAAVPASSAATEKPAVHAAPKLVRAAHEPAKAQREAVEHNQKQKRAPAPKVAWNGKYECILCEREGLTAAEFSAKAMQNFRSKARKPLKCKECVVLREQEERRAAATKLQEKVAQLGEGGVRETSTCSSCKAVLPKLQFNKNQLNKGDKKRCKECIEAAEAAAEAALQQSKSSKIQEFASKLATLDRSEEALKEAREKAASVAAELKKAAGAKLREKKAAEKGARKRARNAERDSRGGEEEAAAEPAPLAPPGAEPPRKTAETREERAAYFRAQAALKMSAEEDGSGNIHAAGTVSAAAAPKPVQANPTPAETPKVSFTKEERIAYFRAQAALKMAAECEEAGGAPVAETVPVDAAAASPEPVQASATAAAQAPANAERIGTKEERIAYFRAQAALKKATEAAEAGELPAIPTAAVTALEAVVTTATPTSVLEKRPFEAARPMSAGHNDSRYIKKFTLKEGDGNGQNKKVKF